MLVKCICSSCSHSYLADDQVGGLACPRCGTDNNGAPSPSKVADVPSSGRDEMSFDSSYQGLDLRFAPLAPPPMFVTGDRLLKCFLFGGLVAVALGAVLGGAQAAVQAAIPGLAGVVLGLVGGIACRWGLGGRSAVRTLGRTLLAVLPAMALGLAGVVAGSWAVERYTGTADRDANGQPDVAQTREDLEKGLRALLRERSRTQEAGPAAVLDQRITETERLKHFSDAQLEDYLWNQRAGLGQPLVSYAKLRVLDGPALKLGPDSDPVELPEHAVPGILLGELLVALVLAVRAVMPR
jgi:hypothetical protein